MPTSKCHLLSLPPEILQHIYIFSLSPNFPHASPYLAAVLSAPYLYRLTFLYAFWNSGPLQYVGMSHRPPLYNGPGSHLRRLFYPLSGPLSVIGINEKKRIELQKSVMRCRWCTFDNARQWLEEIRLAVTEDVLTALDVLPSLDTQTRLDCLIAKWPASRATFVTSTFDGSELALKSSDPFVSALSADYRGPDPEGVRLKMTLAPTTFFVLPPHLLTGKPEWTREKVDSLQLFSSYVSPHAVKCQREAFHEGMRNAIIQRHYDALLTLVWLGTRSVEFGVSEGLVAATYDENPFKPPPELFRLVAKQGMRPSAATLNKRSGYQGKNDEVEISLWLFTLLLRAHAEAMPQNDPGIQAWANQLSTCRDSDGTVKALAQWVIDWKSSYGKFNPREWRQPLFRAGRLSRSRRDEMGIRFEEILGGEVLGFEEQLEKRMQWRDGERGIRED